MKRFLCLIVSVSAASLFAAELRISELALEPQMDRSFVLTTSLPHRVVLDCQSFIQGLNIITEDDAKLYLLEPDECEELYYRIDDSLGSSRRHCIELDSELRSDYACP